MTDRMIRRFAVEGELVETALVRTRDIYHTLLVNLMKDEGYVPLLDVNPVFTTDYRGGERYGFTYTMQGVWVGEEKAWEIDGVMDGKLIPAGKKGENL